MRKLIINICFKCLKIKIKEKIWKIFNIIIVLFKLVVLSKCKVNWKFFIWYFFVDNKLEILDKSKVCNLN